MFGFTIVKKSYVSNLETTITEMHEKLFEMADGINSHAGLIEAINNCLVDVLEDVTELKGNADISFFVDRIDKLTSDVKPIKEFMDEHSKNIKEAEEEYIRAQKAVADGIANLNSFSYETAMKAGKKNE